jgi:hypothetical protein
MSREHVHSILREGKRDKLQRVGDKIALHGSRDLIPAAFARDRFSLRA